MARDDDERVWSLAPAEPNERTARGRLAERLAARHLRSLGYRIVATNARVGRDEIDLVAEHGELTVFVEVRSRRGGSRESPEASLSRGKRRRLARAAAAWLSRRSAPPGFCRFDLVTVRFDGDVARVRLIRGAFVDE